MSVVDLHPEELFDKDARGELTAEERIRLDAHLARCSACRAEQLLRADFAAELDEDDRDSAILGLVQGVLAAPRVADQAHAPEPLPPPVQAPVAAPRALSEHEPAGELEVAGLRRRPKRTAIVLLVAAAVMAASAAGATGLTGRVWQSLRGGNQDAVHTTGTSLATAGTLPVARTVPVVAPLASSTALPELSADGLPTVESSLPAPPAPIAPIAVANVAAPPVRVSAATPVSVVNPPPVAVAAPALPVAAPTSASALFESANTARRSGDTATALSRYDALDRQFPGTPEARLAKATTAKLLLDRGDAAGALSRFDSYLSSGSPELREEAMAGRATALERLGRSDDEARAWVALLATYPRTPYAAHAKARAARSLPQ